MNSEELRIKNRNAIRGFLIYLAAAALFFGYDLCFAGLTGSKHDMLAQGKGSEPNICSYCHILHNSAGDKIWSTWANEAQLTSGPSTAMGNMCYTCHDGTVTSLGVDTVFNGALQQHKIASGQDCNMCHTVHDNTNGKFLVVAKAQSAKTASPTYCEACHDNTMFPGSEHLGDHLAGSEHKYKDDANYFAKSCNTCHHIHGAANYTGFGLTNPILIVDDTDSALCLRCHGFKASYVTGGKKHPANLLTPGPWGRVGCEVCHDVHQPNDPGRTRLLKDANIDSAFCVTCHDETSEANGPKIGYGHSVNVPFSTRGATPSAKDIDDTSDGIRDYPGNSESLVCETCHSAHVKGVAAPLLRIDNSGSALCRNCHQM